MTENHPIRSSIDAQLGAPTSAVRKNASGANSAPATEHSGILHSRKAVLSFVFLVAGILGLPLIWIHPSFTRGQRIFWTVIVLIYTCTLLALAGSLMWWIYRQVIGY